MSPIPNFSNKFHRNNIPMLWNFTDPVDAGVAEGGVGVEATGDGILNDDLFTLFQQLNLLLLNRNRLIYLPRLLIQKVDDKSLFFN